MRYCVSPVSLDIRGSLICVDTCSENPFLRGLLGFQTTESGPMPRHEAETIDLLGDPCVMIGEADNSLTPVTQLLTKCYIGFAM